MKRIAALVWITISLVYGVDIDIESLQQIIQDNPKVIKERLILARHYEKVGNELKALSLLDEALNISADDVDALQMKEQVLLRQKHRNAYRRVGLKTPVNKNLAQEHLKAYYDKQEYEHYTDLYSALTQDKVLLDDSCHIQAGYIHLWDARYKEAKAALSLLQHEDNLEAVKIRADICYYEGDYRCAVKYYEPLYQSSYNSKYGTRLINAYLFLGELNKAERLLTFMKRSNPKNKELASLGEKIDKAKNSYLDSRKKAYEETPNFSTLEAYVIALFAAERKETTLEVLRDYNKNHDEIDALRLEAKYLTWVGQTDRALEILENSRFDKDLHAKLLMGQIYSWDQKFERAKKYLSEVKEKSKNTELRYEAAKALCFVQFWEGNKKAAKEGFEALLKQKENDTEIQEALMELNSDYAGLIKIYKKRLKASPNSPNLQLRLGQLYIGNNQKDAAIVQLRDYLKAHPNDLEATRTLGELLVGKKEYYEGFGYLEYYAAEKKTEDATLLLAKNYYWSGFPKEALDVLNPLIKSNPDNAKAQTLKSKILKVAPRFTSSNSGATISRYYTDLGVKQLELADTLYLNGHYKASLMYYESYLEQHPYEHEVRKRYAFALENAQEYGKAEGEFFLLTYQNNSVETRYHYAYNMMKNGKIEEAKKIFDDIKAKSFQALTPALAQFLNNWKKAWESQKYRDYAEFYAANYTEDKKWSYRKQTLFSELNYITVGVHDPLYMNLGNNTYRVRFYQEYTTSRGSDKGYKELQIKCDNNDACYIIHEKWNEGVYQKSVPITPYIDNALKELERQETEPIAFNSKKKTHHARQRHSFEPKSSLTEQEDTNTKFLIKNTSDKTAHSVEMISNSVETASLEKSLNTALLQGYYFEDSDNIRFSSVDLFYKREEFIDNIDVGVDSGFFAIEKKNLKKYEGRRYGATLYADQWSLRLGVNQYSDFSEFVPTLKYQDRYKKHSYLLEFTRQNALFYTYSLCSYENRISTNHFQASDYVNLGNEKDLWASFALDDYDNGDLAFTPQFDYRFYYDTIVAPDLTYHLAVEGWYTSHTKTNDCFYSPDFYDSTLVRIDPEYHLSKSLRLQSKFGVGYSFYAKSLHYKYGVWLKGTPLQDMDYSFGCLQSNSSRGSFAGSKGYSYVECKAELGYRW